MSVLQGRALPWAVLLAVIVPLGILSRLAHTGFVLFDKYLGDALYATVVYAVFRLSLSSRTAAFAASAAMIGIEVFQLTGFAAHLLTSEHLAVRILARLLGTYFSYLDLLAYAAGIGCVYLVDCWRSRISDSR